MENFDADNKSNGRFHFAVQQVFRPNQDFRGYAGTISEGNLKVGDKIRIHPSGSKSKVKTISVGMKSVKSAIENQSIVLSLEDEIDISRGDLLTKIDEQVLVSDHLEIDVAWLSDIEAIKGRSFTIRAGGQNRFKLVCLNQLGGIGKLRSQFISNADGINCKKK